MDKFNFKRFGFLKFLLFLILIYQCQNVQAQQTIINVPSSKILPAGDIIIKDSNRAGLFSDKFTSITPCATMGIGFGTEISTAIRTSIDANKNTAVRGDFSAKKVWFLGSASRLTVGGTLSPYLTEASHPNTFFFSHLSHRIKKTRTSLTTGVYFNGAKKMPDEMGVLLGIEQVLISNKLRTALDWLSTQDSYGKMGVGLKYRPVPTISITSAVIIPNKKSKNVAFNVSVSKYISLDNENPIKRRLINVD